MSTMVAKFQESWKEALMIGGVAAIATYFGIGNVVSGAAKAAGVAGAVTPEVYQALLVGGVVFASNIIYDLALRS